MSDADVDRAAAAEVLERLVGDLTASLAEEMRGLYVHGSWAAGDFDPARSDLDLLAVTRHDPDEALVDRLGIVHEAVVADFPEWIDRIEVEYVSTEGLGEFRTTPHLMARISPGEPLHLVTATQHYVLNWYAAREQGIVLMGPPARTLIPEISDVEVRAVVRYHLAQWPRWATDMSSPASQAYAVLTLSRALSSLVDGQRRSKRQAARYAAELMPEWSELTTWAEQYRYAEVPPPGSENRDRLPAVAAFVHAVIDRIEHSD